MSKEQRERSRIFSRIFKMRGGVLFFFSAFWSFCTSRASLATLIVSRHNKNEKMATAQAPRVFGSMKELVDRLGGKRVIEKILIANNGIGAVKAIRSIRRWVYEMFQRDDAVHFVVMATPEDLAANAEYIRMASEVVDVPGGANNNNYANVSLIVSFKISRGGDKCFRWNWRRGTASMLSGPAGATPPRTRSSPRA